MWWLWLINLFLIVFVFCRPVSFPNSFATSAADWLLLGRRLHRTEPSWKVKGFSKKAGVISVQDGTIQKWQNWKHIWAAARSSEVTPNMRACHKQRLQPAQNFWVYSEFLSFFVLYSRLLADFLSHLGKWVKLIKFEAENECFCTWKVETLSIHMFVIYRHRCHFWLITKNFIGLWGHTVHIFIDIVPKRFQTIPLPLCPLNGYLLIHAPRILGFRILGLRILNPRTKDPRS